MKNFGNAWPESRRCRVAPVAVTVSVAFGVSSRGTSAGIPPTNSGGQTFCPAEVTRDETVTFAEWLASQN